ncbi:helix-turn-helix domain-containing protein [Palleronia sediminis]|uniref:Helix-turn-helix domain-containing protein n=1 Tax=Palleronia sediminis TaxID=2547833 RepID=A0A4R6AK42_9RHOB|nr:helix-turn-helix domain-containing protein [Palleronia sediminis]TDL83735.1 helix-turn-helix domain-containing protein [Palleronia sediminis]
MIGRFRQQDAEQVEDLKGFDDYDLRLGDVMRGERATLGKSLLDIQRDLKIKATYIAAIENCDPTAFETPGFIAGYVRSYARYLDLDPDWAFRKFSAESGFTTAHGMSQAASVKRADPVASRREAAPRDPFGEKAMGFALKPESFLSRVEPAAIGSMAVLVALIGVIGYGGFAVLNEVQKVQVVPMDQAPEIVAELDPLSSAEPVETPDAATGSATLSSEGFDRLYRPQALDVPVLVARDAPIAQLDPREIGALSDQAPQPDRLPDFGATTALAGAEPEPTLGGVDAAVAEALATPALGNDVARDEDVTLAGASPQVVSDDSPEIVVFAVDSSWVRVRAADGTTLYEKVMEEGDRFVLPRTEEPATLRTGQSGAIYFSINGTPYGPAGSRGAVTGNLALAAEDLTQSYEVADIAADTALARVVAELRATPPQAPGAAAPETE